MRVVPVGEECHARATGLSVWVLALGAVSVCGVAAASAEASRLGELADLT
jgi:hypothetical protein